MREFIWGPPCTHASHTPGTARRSVGETGTAMSAVRTSCNQPYCGTTWTVQNLARRAGVGPAHIAHDRDGTRIITHEERTHET
jgi:hypothetical protein